MNITFLIGNGFDLNLGLDTKYSDFIKEYKKTKKGTDTLNKLHKHIKENEDMWSVAEVALGVFTGEFETGAGEAFSECHEDFCDHLVTYLKAQEERIDFDVSKEKIGKAFSKINKIIDSFPVQEYTMIYEQYKRRQSENIKFSFVTFNYTETLDKCIEILKQTPDALGVHYSNHNTFKHIAENATHVHGTLDSNMIFGVNDETQIAKNDIFDCEDGDLYKGLLIKQAANASYLENTDAKVVRIIEESNIIYIYGMSLGITDKLWWERICKWLNASSDRHLIIQKHNAPLKTAFPIKYQIFERKAKKEITYFCDFEPDKKANIEKRIHIATENIFKEIENIATERVPSSITDIIPAIM